MHPRQGRVAVEKQGGRTGGGGCGGGASGKEVKTTAAKGIEISDESSGREGQRDRKGWEFRSPIIRGGGSAGSLP